MENKNTTTLTEQTPEESKCNEDSVLPIAEKGLFFHDSFFEDIRKHFETAIDQILDTWGESKSVSDLMSSYRRVRGRNLQQENQVMAYSEDDQNHKVVLDVHDFKSGDVKVRVEDNEVVVEGRVEKEEDDFKSMKNFYRRFNFPSKVNMEAMTSAMSSDGVLTVTAPKIPQAA
ncbi:protein lethal(2)essential for life-like [Penaeus chinensis]|uniref:protein lethal(2)essential for life-like n=1 Tax=Penaeus chinensis TaxID=139456 RepID=UPI001FB7C3B4|nr:protein lethal(2)essential for life-like [Penaeus chinensis]XP_047475005.1 protein lethal(2)essential for life-like [Penaeus chinensis]